MNQDTITALLADGGPFLIRIDDDPGDDLAHVRIAAEVWALPGGGFAWADLWWDQIGGHPFHVREGTVRKGAYGGPQVADAELMTMAESDPGRGQWQGWLAHQAQAGDKLSRDRAFVYLRQSGLIE